MLIQDEVMVQCIWTNNQFIEPGRPETTIIWFNKRIIKTLQIQIPNLGVYFPRPNRIADMEVAATWKMVVSCMDCT